MQAVRIHAFGGPEVISLEDVAEPTPTSTQVRVRAEAIGVNFIDTGFRGGLRPLNLPTGLGLEAVGVIDAVGEAVSGFKAGDRVGYYLGPIGAYAEAHCAEAAQLVRIPTDIPADVATCLLTKAITAQYLLRRTFRVEAGHKVMVHAAAGGVGLIMTQWAKALGAVVVGGVGSDSKIAVARENGCDHVVNTRNAGWQDEVRRAVGEVDVVYDSIGKDTFEGSLDVLRIRGAFVSFGAASGPLPPVDLGAMAVRGSYMMTRTNGFHYSRNPEEIGEAFDDVLAAYRAGHIKPIIHKVLPLSEAAEAHRALASRGTVGSLVLRP